LTIEVLDVCVTIHDEHKTNHDDKALLPSVRTEREQLRNNHVLLYAMPQMDVNDCTSSFAEVGTYGIHWGNLLHFVR
jgi:hypothetical protein